jgi:CheY-like chemotaxis protein
MTGVARQVLEQLRARRRERAFGRAAPQPGVALARLHEPDLALVDLRLADDELGTEVAAQLAPRGKLGILYATGNISQVVLSLADGHACLSKPYRAADLLRSLEIVTEIVDSGAAFPPFPRGLQILHPGITGMPAVLI